MSSISQLREGLLSKRLAAFSLILAAIIAIAVSIAPGTAFADYREGDTCPYCESGRLIQMYLNDTQHAFSCDNANCVHCGDLIWEDH